MAEVYDQIQATDSGGSKFVGVRVNTGAAGEFLAVAGDTVVTEQTKRVASMRVNVSSAAGFGQVAGLTTDAAVEGDGATGTLLARVRGITKNIGAGTDGVSPADGSGTIVSNLRALVVKAYGKYTTPTHTQPAIAATTTVALASNANRLYALLVNDSDTTIYVKLGVAAVLSQGIRLSANGGSYELSGASGSLYTGAINAIHGGTGTKNLIVTEGT